MTSLINEIYSRSVKGEPEPQVGMGATMLAYSDRYAGTIAEVRKSGKEVVVQQDHVLIVGGSIFDGSAVYEYKRNPTACGYVFRKDSKGFWRQCYREPGTDNRVLMHRKGSGFGLYIGRREEYRDPHF